MNSICIIPARGGSKGVPRKNVRLLGNKPLIAYSIESALNSNLFENVIVTTDDAEIAKTAKKYGAEVPFMRPAHLASDISSNYDVLFHAVKKLKSLDFRFDISCYRDPTVPFITEADLSGGLELLINSNCNAVFGSIRSHPSPYFGMMEKNSKGYLKPSKSTGKLITRRQDAPIVYSIDGFFIHKVDKLIKKNNFFVSKILPYEISKEHAHMIDFEIDFTIAEILLTKIQNN